MFFFSLFRKQDEIPVQEMILGVMMCWSEKIEERWAVKLKSWSLAPSTLRTWRRWSIWGAKRKGGSLKRIGLRVWRWGKLHTVMPLVLRRTWLGPKQYNAFLQILMFRRWQLFPAVYYSTAWHSVNGFRNSVLTLLFTYPKHLWRRSLSEGPTLYIVLYIPSISIGSFYKYNSTTSSSTGGISLNLYCFRQT